MKVALESDRRAELRGEVVAFDRFWMRVKLGGGKATAREGSNVGLELGSFDGEPPIQVNGIVWRAPAGGVITILLSLSSQEFSRLQGLVNASADSRAVPLPAIPPAHSTEPQMKSPGRAPVWEREAHRPAAPGRAKRSSPNPAEAAARAAGRGDYEAAARLYTEALRDAPEDVSLWFALGAALRQLRRWREAAEAFGHVVRHGRHDSREVRLARVWLEGARIGGEPAPAREASHSERSASAEARPTPVEPVVELAEASSTHEEKAPHASLAARPLEADEQGTPVEPAAEPPEPSLAQKAAMLEAQGKHRKAAKLYYQALHAAPEDASLWYALGAILHRLNQSKAAARAFEKVVEHGEPDAREVQLARDWLEARSVPAERPAPDVRVEPEEQSQADLPGESAEVHAAPPVTSASPESQRPTPPVEAPPPHPSSARQAALLAARGDYEGAARHYYEAFQQALGAAPDDALLWYAFGVTLQHLNQGKAAAQAFAKVMEHGRSGSREVRLARLWLELGEAPVGPVGAEPKAKPSEEAAAPPAEAPSVSAPIEPETRAAPTEPRAQSSGLGATARRQVPAPPAAPLDDPWELGRAFERDMPVPTVEPRVKARPSSSAVQREESAASAAPPLERSSPGPASELETPSPASGPRARPSSRGLVPPREPHRPSRSGRTRRRSEPSLAEEAAILAARGDYEEAAHLYSEALQAASQDISLWYALGVTLHRLRRSTEAAEAFGYVVRHGRPGSQEARLARVWLERGGISGKAAARS